MRNWCVIGNVFTVLYKIVMGQLKLILWRAMHKFYVKSTWCPCQAWLWCHVKIFKLYFLLISIFSCWLKRVNQVVKTHCNPPTSYYGVTYCQHTPIFGMKSIFHICVLYPTPPFNAIQLSILYCQCFSHANLFWKLIPLFQFILNTDFLNASALMTTWFSM